MTTYPLGREQFGIPAIAPVVSPGPLRPAVNEELHGIFLGGIEVRRLDQEAFDVVVRERRGTRTHSRSGHRDLGENRIIEVSERGRRLCPDTAMQKSGAFSPQMAGFSGRSASFAVKIATGDWTVVASENQRVSIWRQREVAVRSRCGIAASAFAAYCAMRSSAHTGAVPLSSASK